MSLTQRLIDHPEARLVKQGAEAVSPLRPCPPLPSAKADLASLHPQKVYKTPLYPSPLPHASSSSSSLSPLPPTPVLLKHRFPKQYRHPTLDALLTRQRLTAEARALVKCKRAGVAVPGLRMVDVRAGTLAIEWVDGWSVRQVLGGGQEEDELPREGEEGEDEDGEDEAELVLERAGVTQGELADGCDASVQSPSQA